MFKENREYYSSLDKEGLIEEIDRITNINVKKIVEIKKLNDTICELTRHGRLPAEKNDKGGITSFYKSEDLKNGFQMETYSIDFCSSPCQVCNLPFKISEIKINNFSKDSGLKLCIKCLKQFRCMLNEIIDDTERLMDEQFPKVGTKAWIQKLASVNTEK